MIGPWSGISGNTAGSAQTAVNFVIESVLSRRYMALLDAHSSIVTSLLVVMAKKNAPIFHHCARVAGYALQIAYSLELTPPEFENLVVAALLHDVGKVGINDELLHKSGSLTDPEWEMMKQHSRSGADILGPYASFRALLPAILHHHERFDGLGYPDQLVGAAIPLHARIISVADTYDAIITDRPYRSACSHAFACEEIARVAGSQLDPVIVSHFLRIAQALQRSGLKYTNRTDVSADLSTNNHQL